MRLADNALSDKSWIESIANLLARKSSERWIDNDETEFHHQLGMAAGRFKRTELAAVGTTKKLNGHGPFALRSLEATAPKWVSLCIGMEWMKIGYTRLRRKFNTYCLNMVATA